ncbi:MAG: STAS domain-containing protein [Planctomycetota bacterium]
MNIGVEHYGRCVMLNIKGEITEDGLGALIQTINTHLQEDGVSDLVLNLDEVPYIDSVSLEYLWDLRDHLHEADRHLRLVGPDENVQKIFEITRLDGKFDVFHDVGEVLKTFQT